MAQSFEESLFQAIKKDDIKAFGALMEKARCGAYRMGRFPVLSLLYLYKSRRLISAYEQSFIKITDFGVLREPAEISNKFSAKAGKCLRLYLNEVVSPLEMLLILDKTKRLKRVYPLAKPSQAVKERLKSIYSIKYALSVKFEGDNVILDRRPLSYREKKNIAAVCLCAVFAVTLSVGVPLAVTLRPDSAEGGIAKPDDAEVPDGDGTEPDGGVTQLSQIDFASANKYTLKQDVVLPENFSAEKVNCTINGGGNKLIFGKGASLGEFNGKLSDVTVESSGTALFTSVSEDAAIENVTVNVTADLTASDSSALIAVTNYGTIDGVAVNVSGCLNATANENAAELTFGGIVLNNSYRYITGTQTIYRGIIKNCTVNYLQFKLAGEAAANAAFGGVAGTNSGYLQNCKVTGNIIADTFDLAGVCFVNNGKLTDSVNEAELSQTSADTGWNPITGGIVYSNAYALENCENKGKISAVSVCGQFDAGDYEPTVSAAGIAVVSSGTTVNSYIKNCTNSGDIECTAEYRNVYAAGVCLSSDGGIESCKNDGAVTAVTDNGCAAYAGGISALAFGSIYKSANGGAITVTGTGAAYAGGISAHSCSQFLYCFSDGNIEVTAKSVWAGGIFGFSDVTSFGYYVYCGTAEYCISAGDIKVTATDEETPAYVGGIAGFVREAGFSNGDGSAVYFGGCVTDCYFTGGLTASDGSYAGSIAGVCGANVYESNSYTSGNAEYHNFEGNFYLENSAGAFGATVTADGSFASAEDKGATAAPPEEMENSEKFKQILAEAGQ